MRRKRYKPEQNINLLREAEVGLSQGQTVGEICRSLGIGPMTGASSYAYSDQRVHQGLSGDRRGPQAELGRCPAVFDRALCPPC